MASPGHNELKFRCYFDINGFDVPVHSPSQRPHQIACMSHIACMFSWTAFWNFILHRLQALLMGVPCQAMQVYMIWWGWLCDMQIVALVYDYVGCMLKTYPGTCCLTWYDVIQYILSIKHLFYALLVSPIFFKVTSLALGESYSIQLAAWG